MSRIQLGLNVSDLEATAGFHSTLFGVEPAKGRPRVRQLRDRRAAAEAGADGAPMRVAP